MDAPDCYSKASEYWSTQPATVDGMLGGLSKVSAADIALSTRVFEQLKNKGFVTETNLVLDVGSGIGRITKHFLAKQFKQVDVLEADAHFLAASPEYLGPEVNQQIRKRYPMPLQDFKPEPESYDCVWCQWVLSHLRDEDLLASLIRLKKSLRTSSNGVLFVKENLAKEEDEFDTVDNSVTRPRERFMELFEEAGLTLIKEAKQSRFPTNLYEVRLFALQ